MNFEAKYLIRWAIPGWVFATWIIILAFGTIDPLTIILTKGTNFLKVFGILVTLLSFGVPLGYLFHQIYFTWEWIRKQNFLFIIPRPETDWGVWKLKVRAAIDTLKPIKEKLPKHTFSEDFHDNYYYIEFVWHELLLGLEEEERNYIIGRYRYFLSTIHGLGSLMYSLATSLVLSFFFIKAIDGPWEAVGLSFVVIAQLFLLIATYNNYNYYSKNLIAFQANFFEKFIGDSEPTTTLTPVNKPNQSQSNQAGGTPATNPTTSSGNGGAGDTTT